MRLMDRPTGQHDLIERIHAAPHPPVLLAGPAASGKTSAALDLYRATPGAAAILAPNAAAVRYLRRRLLAESDSGIIVAPQVSTFAALAQQILAHPPHGASAPGCVLSDFQRTLLLRRLIDELAGAGKLDAFRDVLDTQGLVTSLDAAIAELKRAAIEPNDFAAALDDDVAENLHTVYAAYQDYLLSENVFDVEGQMWLARDFVAAFDSAGRPSPALTDVDTLIVDGFTDFTPTQLETLHLVSRHVKRMLITLPCEATGRQRLWHWTRRTLERVRRTFGDELTILAPDSSIQNAFAPMCERLFDHAAELTEAPKGLSVIVAAGIEQEVAVAAARIKRLLVDGASAGRIAVIVRSLGEYRPIIERVFTKADIPIGDVSRPLTDVPVIRFLLAAAAIGPDCRSENVLAVIANSYFRPQALGEFDPRTVATAQALIREANVLRDRTSYAAAADRFAQLAERRPLADEDGTSLAPEALLRSGEDLRQAGDMLEALFDLGAQSLPALAAALQLTRSICDQTNPCRIARDLRALSAMEAALASLDGSPPLRALRDALRTVRCPPARSESVVDVLDALDARACRTDHVFLLGLTESLFPRAFTETPLLTEARRHRLTERGMPVDVRSDLAAREMLLFYLCASRADESLTLGTLESDAAGKPCGASPFLTALAAPLGGLHALPTQTVPLGQFVPDVDHLTSGADAVNRAWVDLFAPNGTSGPALGWMRHHAPEAAASAAMGLWAADRRWRAGECDAFDGRITDSALQAALATRYPGETVFSASQLESYAHCPWRYFARYVLGLDEPPSRQPHMDAALRGKIVHEILCELLTRLTETHGRPLDLKTLDAKELTGELAAVTQRVSDRMRRRFSPPYPTLWQVQIDRLVGQVRRYLDAARTDTVLPGRAVRFELAFGMPGAAVDDEPEDAASAPQPVVIATPGGDIRLRGRIDRVDTVDSDVADGLLVVDYKTGVLPPRARINECQNVQIPLYALAAETLLDEPCIGGMYQRIGDEPKSITCAKVKLSRGGVRPDDTYDATLDATRQAVGRYVSAMAAGVFDALPTHDCPPFCPVRQICQFTERRRQLKTPATEGVS